MKKFLCYLLGKKKSSASAWPNYTNPPKPHYTEGDPEKIKSLQAGSLKEIPVMFFQMMYASHSLIKTYSQIFLNVVDSLTPKQMIRLDGLMRQKSSMEWSFNWQNSDPNDLLLPDLNDNEKVAILGIGSCNPNGYYREKCIRLLSEYPIELTMKYFLLRLNDWVKPVRQLSQQLIYDGINLIKPETLFPLMPYLLWQVKKKNNEDKQLFILCNSILLAQCGELLHESVRGKDYFRKRIAYDVLLRADPPDVVFLKERVLKEKDQSVQSHIMQSLRPFLSGHDDCSFYVECMRCKSAFVKILAVESLYETDPRNSWTLFMSLLFSRNTSVRDNARHYISKQTYFDFRQFYLEKLLEHPSYGSIIGLGETGTRQDMELVYPYLASSNLLFVKAAMQAIVKLDLEIGAETLVIFLGSSTISMSNLAFRLIKKVPHARFEHEIHNLFCNHSDWFVKINCLKLLINLNKWGSLVYIIESIFSSDGHLSTYSLAMYERWLEKSNRTFIQPTREQIEMITTTLDCHKAELPSKIFAEINTLIKSV